MNEQNLFDFDFSAQAKESATKTDATGTVTLNDKQYREITERLAALKALKDAPGTQGEAEAAAAAIQRLLFKYNLSMADVTVTPEKDAYEKTTFDLGSLRWEATLLHVIAKENFCRVVRSTQESKVYFIGQKHNRAVVEGLFDYLRNECNRLLRENVRKRLGSGRSYSHAFRLGFCAAIRDRLRAQNQEDVATYTGGSALVLSKNQEAERALKEYFPRLKSTSARYSSGSGFGAGRTAGNNVNLGKQIRSGTGGRIALGS